MSVNKICTYKEIIDLMTDDIKMQLCLLKFLIRLNHLANPITSIEFGGHYVNDLENRYYMEEEAIIFTVNVTSGMAIKVRNMRLKVQSTRRK